MLYRRLCAWTLLKRCAVAYTYLKNTLIPTSFVSPAWERGRKVGLKRGSIMVYPLSLTSVAAVDGASGGGGGSGAVPSRRRRRALENDTTDDDSERGEEGQEEEEEEEELPRKAR